MEEKMLARAAVHRGKRRPVEFRSTRSPRDLLISLPFRHGSDARTPAPRATAARAIPLQQGR
jgi:hypothetical protein